MKKTVLSAAFAAFALGAAALPAHAAGVGACLITKTDTNPYFVKMKQGAEAKAKELGVNLKAYAGRVDGDNDSQVAAIESCIADGVKGILLVPSDSKAIVESVQKARKAGIMVIALDTPLEPINAADATFATDNFKAGQLIGQWAKETLGDKAKDAQIAYMDLSPSQPSVDVLRDQGFMSGFGIADIKNPTKIQDYGDKRNVCHDTTNGDEEGGRTAMENCLQKDPNINVVYTINEPAAAGAYEALKAWAARRTCWSCPSTAAAPVSRTCRKASSARPRSNIRSRWPPWASRRSRNSPTRARSRSRPRARPSWIRVRHWSPTSRFRACRPSTRKRARNCAGADAPAPIPTSSFGGEWF